MSKDYETHQIISILMKEARHCMDMSILKMRY